MKPLKNKTNTVPPGGDYPFGDLRDNPGDNSGTPVDRNLLGDIHRNVEKIMDVSGIVANNLDDNEANGYQIYDALVKAIRGYRVTILRFNPANTGNEITVIRDELNFGTPTTTKASTGRYSMVYSVSKTVNYLESLTLNSTSIQYSGSVQSTFDALDAIGGRPLKIDLRDYAGSFADIFTSPSGIIIEIRNYN